MFCIKKNDLSVKSPLCHVIDLVQDIFPVKMPHNRAYKRTDHTSLRSVQPVLPVCGLGTPNTNKAPHHRKLLRAEQEKSVVPAAGLVCTSLKGRGGDG